MVFFYNRPLPKRNIDGLWHPEKETRVNSSTFSVVLCSDQSVSAIRCNVCDFEASFVIVTFMSCWYYKF